jgi:hypothetical protein
MMPPLERHFRHRMAWPQPTGEGQAYSFVCEVLSTTLCRHAGNDDLVLVNCQVTLGGR